ncbi:DUF481 domain-containing protein [Caldimonas thermodepolymerans]|jgi:putative salt-induced outer membrane protein|uniref:DUF481 domain-containing protein n=1 Tax=Caldimonas thermodepolymerans TaxID=215580 RepID=UPI00223616EA|nr:DUF481 domain-containing protein [Caldimonas thermodepolymerans]UZG45033.1 DUF481 domain-containing protein [Caldimonas thermodepolymerans]
MSRSLLVAVLAAALPALAWSQVTVKPDGRWRHLFGAGASLSSGNSEASSFNLSADSVRATDHDKWMVTARAQYAKVAGETSAQRFGAGTQYDRDFSPQWFGFGRLELLHDRPANLALRRFVGSGVGHHFFRDDTGFWDATVGLGYTHDRFDEPSEVEGRLRRSYGRAELLLAEESSHTLTQSTKFRQKLTVLPVLEESGAWRAEFDTNLSVAMTERLSLTAGFTYRYNSHPGEGLKRGDALFVTGVSLRLD